MLVPRLAVLLLLLLGLLGRLFPTAAAAAEESDTCPAVQPPNNPHREVAGGKPAARVVNHRYLLLAPIQLHPGLPRLPASSSGGAEFAAAVAAARDRARWMLSNNVDGSMSEDGENEDEEFVMYNSRYELDDRFARGSCGEVWFAYDLAGEKEERVVLKRVFPEKRQSGLREIYFGEMLRSEPHAARFIEAFNRTTPNHGVELWLVFRDEGKSLKQILYAVHPKQDGIVEPSAFWGKLRSTAQQGPAMRREICRHLVLGIHALRQRGVTHRDVKPGNVLITPVRERGEVPVKLGDFGSAIDASSLGAGMFLPTGPTRAEHTMVYEPPEFLEWDLEAAIDHANLTVAFDSWSLGVLMLEILLGTDQIFETSEESKRRFKKRHHHHHHHHHHNDEGAARGLEHLLAFGIDDLELFNQSVMERDRFARGFYDDSVLGPLELDFVFHLLNPDPVKRGEFFALESLRHPYMEFSLSSFDSLSSSSSSSPSSTTPPPVSSTSSSQRATSPETTTHRRPRFGRSHRFQELRSTTTTMTTPTASSSSTAWDGTFFCGKCNRAFSNWEGCHMHAKAKRHDVGNEDPESSLCLTRRAPPPESQLCLDYSVIGPWNPFWCGSNGGKNYMEDFFTASTTDQANVTITVIIVADGHWGESAARFALHHLANQLIGERAKAVWLAPNSTGETTTRASETFMESAFRHTAGEFNTSLMNDGSGAAVTAVVIVTGEEGTTPRRRLITGNVGDVRAFVCCDHNSNAAFQPVVLSKDHVADDESERARIEALPGGFVAASSRTEGPRNRTMGKLVLTRAIGDTHLAPYVVSHPFVSEFRTHPAHSRFLVVCTDGLLDAMSMEDVNRIAWSEMVVRSGEGETREWYKRAAIRLVFEARARGMSSDNLGVAVVPL